jgi:hypothetical protein
VEYCFNGVWGPVCDETVQEYEVRSLCGKNRFSGTLDTFDTKPVCAFKPQNQNVVWLHGGTVLYCMLV